MLATELLFVYVYCVIDDAIKADALHVPRRPGPEPARTDARLLTIALVRHLPGRRSDSGFLAEIRRDWLRLFPYLPTQPGKEITDQMELARHGAHTFEGLLTRTIATLAAHTLLLTQLSDST